MLDGSKTATVSGSWANEWSRNDGDRDGRFANRGNKKEDRPNRDRKMKPFLESNGIKMIENTGRRGKSILGLDVHIQNINICEFIDEPSGCTDEKVAFAHAFY